MRSFEALLQVSGWTSEYKSVHKLLAHLERKTKSESSRRHYLETLASLVKRTGKNPERLVSLLKERAEEAVQSFVDGLKRKDYSVRYVNVCLNQLQTFFRVNGFKFAKSLELERYYQPARYRKKPEYIPTAEEILKMANTAGNVRSRALLMVAYESGLRNSTLRAILYGDVKDELDAGKEVVAIPVYPEMKKVDPDACKGSLPYTTFMSREASEAVRVYLNEYERRHGRLRADSTLFQGNRGRPIKRRTLEIIVKKAARTAGIRLWKDVYPHCLRKAFERAVRNSGLDVKDQEFLIGHVFEGSMDAYYDRTKIDELRAKYERVRFFGPTDAEGIRRQAAKDQLKILEALDVLPKEEIESLSEQLERKPIDEIDWKEVVAQLKRESSRARPRQRSVSSDEAEMLLKGGWKFVAGLSNGKVILEGPTQSDSSGLAVHLPHPPPPDDTSLT
jgi:site-specific recombinase XerD